MIDHLPVRIYASTDHQLPTAQQNIEEPPKIWAGEDLKKLTHWDLLEWTLPGPRTHVRFKTPAAEHREHSIRIMQMKKADRKGYTSGMGWAPGMGAMSDLINVYSVTECQTALRLRWQDGRETVENSLLYTPYRHVDE